MNIDVDIERNDYWKPEKSPIKMLRNILKPDVKEVKAHELTNNCPWPQPSPVSPMTLPHTVIHVPQDEISEFVDKVVKRYVKTLKYQSFPSLKMTLTGKIIERISDQKFSEYVFETCYGRLITKKQTRYENELFFDFIDSETEYSTLNFSTFSTTKTYRNIYLENTITLFKNTKSGNIPIAIHIKDQMITPNSREKWELAKLYVMQGGAIILTACIHPKIHFPVDSLNGITKSLIPKNHLLYKLLEPHMYIQLPLNFAVQYVKKSVAHGNQNEIYTPYPTDKVGFFGQVAIGYKGLKGTEKYRPYKYPMEAEKLDTKYGLFLEAYWDCIYKFVSNVIKSIDPESELIQFWADNISQNIPGFPSGKMIIIDNNFAKAITSYIHTCSVAHATDHYTYSRIPLEHAPMRIRVPFPSKGSDHFKLDIRKLLTKEDYIRHKFCNLMYFKENNLTFFKDCNYNFTTSILRKYRDDFRRDLLRTEQKVRNFRYIPLSEISASIQY